eukprot:TRINITY_DN23064_c0_g1_i1.p1 TRINITY_DN23064_c0_g1~~TRINITY_DN23064_c0_g1_i1.p1  ORF type:complete len:434 (+),score=38.44 TRINITY_DN23064_c0_g1_i1:209-1510(+)
MRASRRLLHAIAIGVLGLQSQRVTADSSVERLRCELDSKWLEAKKRLYFLLQRLSETQEIDAAHYVNLATRGILPEDFERCSMGASCVQLFLQLILTTAKPSIVLEDLQAEPWPTRQSEPWAALSQLSFGDIIASRWPVFDILQRMRAAFLLERVPAEEVPCEALWLSMDDLYKEQMITAADAGSVANILMQLPPEACPAARASCVLALLRSASPSGSSAEQSLLRQAQDSLQRRWPIELLHTRWTALGHLAAVEKRALPDEERRALLGDELRGALVYLHFYPAGMARFHDIRKSLSSVKEHWLDIVPDKWPVIVFVDNETAASQQEELSAQFPSLDLRVAVMEEQDLNWPMETDHPFCSRGYRRAARFTAGPMYMHPALDNITHLLYVDTEFELTHPVPWDPLRQMFNRRAQLLRYANRVLLPSEGMPERRD